MSLAVRVREGTRRVVGRRFVRGNFATSRATILRDLPAPGDPFDEDRLLEGVRKLRDLGIFDTLKVTPIGLEGDRRHLQRAEEIVLVVDVEEARAKFVDLAIGFETLNRDEQSMPDFVTRTLSGGLAASDQRLLGGGESPLIRLPDLLIVVEASFVHRNFLGWGKELHVPLRYGISTTEVNRLASFKPTYLDSRFFGAALQFRFTPFVVYDRATQALDQFAYGAELEVSKQLTRALYGTVEYELSRIQTRDPRSEEPAFSPFQLQNKLNPRLSWDLTDNPLNPSRGLYLGGSVSYINALDDEEFNNFIKFELVAKLYISLRATVTLAFFFRFGGSYSFEDADLPANERYQLGGSQGLRGFADDAVGQYRSDGGLRTDVSAGGDYVINGTVEVRFPIVRSLGFWGAVFLDWGALSEDVRDLSAKSFRVSAGLGLRFLVGGQIPIRLDYGIILDPRCKGFTEEGACVAEEFGNVHFGVLYTF